ncbi:MAG: hypothetical protein WB686_05270, partial [Pseudolabrys sp.]
PTKPIYPRIKFMAAPLRAGELLRPRLQKAYVKAGYKPGKGNAYTMKNGREIQNRVAEILSARAEKVEQQYEAEVEYTRERLLDMLQRAYDDAMDSERGQSAAVSAVVAMARITGQIIDRREVGDPGAFDGKTDEELMEEARKRAAALGLLPPETQH